MEKTQVPKGFHSQPGHKPHSKRVTTALPYPSHTIRGLVSERYFLRVTGRDPTSLVKYSFLFANPGKPGICCLNPLERKQNRAATCSMV